MMRLRQKSERSKKSSGGYGAASSHVVLIPFHLRIAHDSIHRGQVVERAAVSYGLYT